MIFPKYSKAFGIWVTVEDGSGARSNATNPVICVTSSLHAYTKVVGMNVAS